MLSLHQQARAAGIQYAAPNPRHSAHPYRAVDSSSYSHPSRPSKQSKDRLVRSRDRVRSAASAQAGCLPSSALPDARKSSPAFQRAATLALLAAVLAIFGLASSAFAASPTPGSSSGTGLLDFALHLDKHLKGIIDRHGAATYAVLFGIVFAETGFVLTPFLPGDSLLFAAGAFCATGALQLGAVLATFITAAILGDALNYTIGHSLGEKALSSRLIKGEFIAKTNNFYAKYGGKTIVLARFVPIIRTFAPFVAGVGAMHYPRFLAFNVAGALIWTFLFTGAGYYFGNLPFVKENFTLVVLAIVAVSVLPVAFELWNGRRQARPSTQENLVSGAARAEPNFEWIYPKSNTRSPNLDWLM